MSIKRLIQIEYKKMKLNRFWKQVSVANVVIILLTLITKFTFSASGTSSSTLSTVSIIDTFVKSVFIVWQAVLIAMIIVDEFKRKLHSCFSAIRLSENEF